MRLLRRRRVRLHQDPGPSLEGVLIGRPWRNAGHYVLRQPGLLESANRTVMFDGPEAWIPREKVVFVEVLA